MGRRIARLWGIAVVLVTPVLLLPVGAGAIIGGHDDGNGHPNVAFVLAVDQKGALAEACTGTLIGQKAVLTAAHCLVDGVQYYVSFEPTIDLSQGDDGFLPVKEFHSNDEYDVGVLVLARAAGIDPAELPAEGALEKYRKGTSFTHVGYGLNSVPRRNSPADLTHFTRRTLTSPVTKLTDTLLYARNRDGSICEGDSGGPVFSSAGVVVALGNYTSGRCQGTNSGPRLDIEPVRSFLSEFLPR